MGYSHKYAFDCDREDGCNKSFLMFVEEGREKTVKKHLFCPNCGKYMENCQGTMIA